MTPAWHRSLSSNVVAEIGRIPAHAAPDKGDILALKAKDLAPSEAHVEMDRRRARSAARTRRMSSAQFYGHDFDQPLYIQAIALIAQIRLGHLDDVKRLVEPYVNGTKDSLQRPNSLVMAGHTVFTELARKTSDPRYAQMVKKVGDLGFEADGRMKESMPFHDEYSDSVYMGTAIAAQAGALTGDQKVFRPGRAPRRLHAEARSASRWALSPLTRNRGRMGTRQRLPGTRPHPDACRVPEESPRVPSPATVLSVAHGDLRALSRTAMACGATSWIIPARTRSSPRPQ